MSLPPVFTLLAAAPEVTAIVGAAPVRVFPGGVIPQGQAMPAIAWLVVAGMPENMLADRAVVDNQRVQIDCWAADFNSANALFEAVRTALEPHAYLVAMNDPEGTSTNTGYDIETRRYRISSDWSFWVHR
jgi:hypothetical protein